MKALRGSNPLSSANFFGRLNESPKKGQSAERGRHGFKRLGGFGTVGTTGLGHVRPATAALSAQRPGRAPILALTDNLQTLRQLRIVRSVEPYFIGAFGDPEKTLTHALDMLRDADRIKVGDKLVIISDVLATNDERIDSIQLRTVRDQTGA